MMDISVILLIVFILGTIVSGILLLKQSAKKFHLTDAQKKSIEARKKQQEQKDIAENSDD